MIDSTRSRSKSIGVRVTESDFARLQALADAQAKPLGELCREILLEWTLDPSPTAADRALLAEMLGLRTILLNLFFRLANGEPITADEMHGLIERADADKLKKALVRLEETEKLMRVGGKP